MKEIINLYSETFVVKLYQCAATFPERKIQEKEIRNSYPPQHFTAKFRGIKVKECHHIVKLVSCVPVKTYSSMALSTNAQ